MTDDDDVLIAPEPESDPEGASDDAAPNGVESPPYDVRVAITSTLSYALAHNRIPVVHSVSVRGGARSIRGAELEIVLRDAHGPIGPVVRQLLDLEPDRETVLTGLNFQLDPGAMLQIEEQRPGKLDVRIVQNGEILAASSADVHLLASNQWLARPLSLGLEMLAAFVQPNHPEIAMLTAEASVVLERATGNDAMEGYQAEPERVDAVAQAIVRAMQDRDIRYVLPPASWGDDGQKIRTPGEVLEHGAGTCLDTTLVLAAAFEHAGIRPLIWIVEGHAFLGYWRIERSFEAAAITDVGDAVNLVDLGAIGLIETTLMTQSDELSFEGMQRDLKHKWLSGSFSKVIGVNDLYRSRRDQILPLPVRRIAADGQTTVFEYRPATPNAAQATPINHARAGGDQRVSSEKPAPPPRVAHWKNALLDLSLRNRLINFTDSARLKLAVPAERIGKLEEEISQGHAFTLMPSDRIGAVQRERDLEAGAELPADVLVEFFDTRRSLFSNISSDAYLGRLRNLAYQARTLIEETGANNLYLAFGSLVWSIDGRQLRSPLILVPVSLAPTSRNGMYRVTLDESGASTPNYCLLEKLKQLHGLEIPELEHPDVDGSGIHLDQCLLATRHALLAKGLSYRVEETVDLSILQFAKYRLWKDLDEHWEEFESNALVRHLIRTPYDRFVDPISATIEADLDDLAAKSPMPADSSQLRAVAEAVGGKTFVLEGPPGTGKSQTITNLLTRAIADGQRVLFVAEKRAALDVVQRRLDDVGLGLFSLDLHDRHSKPNEVRRQLKSALEAQFDVDEQGFVDTMSRLEAARRRLEAYPRRLHERNAAGHSYYSARTQELAIDADVPLLPIPDRWPAQATPEAFAEIRSLLHTLSDVADSARPADPHAWGFIDLPNAASLDPARIKSTAQAFDAALVALPTTGVLAQVVAAARQLESLVALSAVLAEPSLARLDHLDTVRTPEWERQADALLRALAACETGRFDALKTVSPAIVELDLADIDRKAQSAASSGFFGRKGRLKSAAEPLGQYLLPGINVDLKHLTDLTGKLAALGAVVTTLRAQAAALPVLDVPQGWNPLLSADQQWVTQRIVWLRWNAGLVDPQAPQHLAPFATAMRALHAEQPVISPSGVRAIADVTARLQDLVAAAEVSPSALLAWSGESGLVVQWEGTALARRVNDGPATVRAWLDLLAHVEPMRREGLLEARSALLGGHVGADDAVRSFAKGVADASRRERARSTGIEPFDEQAHERRIRQFVEASKSVRTHLVTSIPREVVAARTFDPTAEAGRVGRLSRELGRQRGGMGVRTLLDTFGDLITAIMPCVLVSPDSVARFFPAKAGQFDIVVFDEASQIRVADAIGAMGRGRSVVVVGDSKQMPPTAFAEPSLSNDDVFDAAEDVVEDEESILSECVNAQVPRQWLSWHYRSQDEALIAFSNQQYYEHRLSSFPAPVHGPADPGPGGHGVSLVRVDGTFLRSRTPGPHRTNPVEAQAILDEIQRRFAASPDEAPSIGVVTFNVQQRNLIESMLRDTGDVRVLEALDDSDGLFVKNLENVQGDERDSIFFSTAFSVNERGVLPLNFGPLNRAGGERRLNVAVTRARRQVVVFSSFDPEQLRAEETSSVGVKHLRAYLDRAAAGSRELPTDGRARQSIDRHRDDIAMALRGRGYAVRTDVGLSEFRIDLVISTPEEPDRPVMAVLLDGEAWAARRTVGDRDGLPQDVLTRMLGWPAVERIWMPAWLANQSSVLDDIDAAFATALNAIDRAQEATEFSEPALSSVDEDADDLVYDADDDVETERLRLQLEQLSSVASPQLRAKDEELLTDNGAPDVFAAWTLRDVGQTEVLDRLPARAATQAVASLLLEIVEAEGPIHYDRLTRAAAAAFGLSRVSAARESAILAALPADVREYGGDRFAWPTRLDRTTWRGYRRASSVQHRPIEHISQQEIANGMTAIAHGAAGIERDELKREALALFGGRRMTAAISDVLDAALAFGISDGRLVSGAHGLIYKGR